MPTNIFLPNGFGLLRKFFRVNLKARLLYFGFMYYFATKNPTETKGNSMIAQFIVALLCFQSENLSVIKYLIEKKSSVKNIRQQKVTKLLASDEMFPTNIFVVKFLYR